jgi:hypothetical protein
MFHGGPFAAIHPLAFEVRDRETNVAHAGEPP